MAKNDFKPFATGKGANVTLQSDWEALPALLSGFTAGKASSAQVNKALRQASFIAAALAQYTASKSGQDVLDDGDLSGFIAKMSAAFGKDFQTLDATLTALAGLATGADKLPYFNGDDTAALTVLTQVGRDIIGKNAIADVLTYLQLGEAAKRAVGTGTNQIPDMASFAAGPGWMKFPSGKIIQHGYHTSSASGAIIVNFPIPFPTQCFGVTGAGTDASAANIAGCHVIDKAGFNLSAWLVAANSVFNQTATNISWIAVGI
ncbi:phage tail protein [Salmonella enterica]|nr:phage tail protein [Salmonella enterica]EKS4716825.1 phage tail protein [Salmonella enterica]EKS4721693.1 phage tail protein [Salmonella enterica]EKS4734933.1 phage tail protein [Salmonella enterica]EKS4772029.1 phage tail protein [Salmonella enterica]